MKVLIVVEGGIARAVEFPPEIEGMIVDWDVVDETGEPEEIQQYIDIVESLPESYPSDRAVMLATLHERLASLDQSHD